MRKISVIILILLVFISACGRNLKTDDVKDVHDDKGDSTNNAGMATDNSVASSDIKTSDGSSRLSFDCKTTLRADDVAAICGDEITRTQSDPKIYGPCDVYFENPKGYSFRFIYYRYPLETDTAKSAYDVCINAGGKSLAPNICQSGSNIYIYKNKYSISLGNEYTMENMQVCTEKQIQEIAKLVDERI